MLSKLTFSVAAIFSMFLHPFHVSVMDAQYQQSSQSLQISHRLFLDDLEDALKDFHDLEYVDTVEPEDPEALDKLIAAYLKEKVFFVINGEDKQFSYYGSELEGDARWCYYEVKEIDDPAEIEITNVALMDVFDDQQNIIHIKVKDRTQSFKLDKSNKVKKFTF